MPEASVVTDAEMLPPNKPPAPDEGDIVKTTPILGTPAPVEFVTFAFRGVANAVPTRALCGVPDVPVIDTGPVPLPTVKLCETDFVAPLASVAVAVMV